MIDMQAATQAGMHALYTLGVGGQQAVEMDRGVRCRRESAPVGGARGFQRGADARPDRSSGPSARIVEGQAGHGNQDAILQVHQGNRVTGQNRTDGGDQSLELDFARHRIRKIDSDLSECAVNGLLGGHVRGSVATRDQWMEVGVSGTLLKSASMAALSKRYS